MSVGRESPLTTKRVLPPMYLFFGIPVMVVLHLLLPWQPIVPPPWRFTGIVPLVLGLVLNLAADRLLKQHGTTVKPFQKSTSLVAFGVYRISRNPMYLGFVLILLGLAILLG